MISVVGGVVSLVGDVVLVIASGLNGLWVVGRGVARNFWLEGPR